jgi:hypothetical protein
MWQSDTFGGPTVGMYLAHMPTVAAVVPRHVVTLTAPAYGIPTA